MMPSPTWWKPYGGRARTAVAHVAEKVDEDEASMVWLDGRGREERTWTYAAAWRRAGRIGHFLRGAGACDRGDRVLLCFAPGLEFFVAFWGCLRAAVVAVPVYPLAPSTMETSIARLTRVSDQVQAALCLTDNAINVLRQTVGLAYSTWPKNLTWRSTEGLGVDESKLFLSRRRGPDLETLTVPPADDDDDATEADLAFLQYTSGSTSSPKGVMIGHDNLWHNVSKVILPMNRRGFERLRQRGVVLPQRFAMISWLPTYHDMGLIYAHVAPFCHGDDVYYMSPLTFLSTPELWLEAASRYGAHYTASPDFGYKLVARRVEAKDPARFAGRLDLTKLFYCMTAAERVRPSTYSHLNAVLEPFGFRAVVVPAYGLAETVVGATFSLDDAAVGITPRRSTSKPNLCCCGNDFSVVVRIVDPDARLDPEREVPSKEIGEIWLSSGSVARGYWGMPELSAEIFQARLEPDDGRCYLRTQDEGFLEEGRLYVCGRRKDLIIVQGINIYAEDVETAIVERVSADVIRHGAIAAFGVEIEDEEQLVVVCEIRNPRTAEDASRAIVAAVLRDVGLRPRRVVAIKQATIPRTTSGKIRRQATRQALEDGALDIVHDYHYYPSSSIRAPAKTDGGDGEHRSSCLDGMSNEDCVVVVPRDDDDDRTAAEIIPIAPPPPAAARLKCDVPVVEDASVDPENPLGLHSDSKIAIVGAGLGGLSLAHYLQQQGFESITVFERNDHVGGKAAGVWCESLQRWVSGGQYAINDDFENLLALGTELGVDLRGVVKTSLLKDVKFFDPVSGIFVDDERSLLLGTSYESTAERLGPVLHAIAETTARLPAVGFGSTRDSHDSFHTFLASQGFVIEDVERVCERLDVLYGPQGYLSARDAVPDLYRLKMLRHNGSAWNAAAPDAYRLLCERLAQRVEERGATRVETGANVVAIEYEADRVRVRLSTRTEEFEALVVTAHPRDVEKSSSGEVASLASEVRLVDYCCTIVTASGLPEVAYIPRHWLPESTGRVFRVCRARSTRDDDEEHDPSVPTLYSCFQYGSEEYATPSSSRRLDDSDLELILRNDIELLGGRVSAVHGTKRWQYFPRVSGDALRENFYDRLEGIQGLNRTFWAGSLMSYELAEDTCAYSKSLVDRFFRLQLLHKSEVLDADDEEKNPRVSTRTTTTTTSEGVVALSPSVVDIVVDVISTRLNRRVGANDTLQSLAIASIWVMELVEAIASKLDLEPESISVVDIMTGEMTVAEFASSLTTRPPSSLDGSSTLATQKKNKMVLLLLLQGLVDVFDLQSRGGLLLSFNQLQWLTECASIERGSSQGVGILPLASWMRGAASAAALRKALNELVQRHAILRTTYGLDDDGRFTQTVHEVLEVTFVDETAGSEAEALERARKEQSAPFDLLRGDPVIRSLLVRLAPSGGIPREDMLLVVFVHHVACDGMSTRIMLRELRELYLAATCGTNTAGVYSKRLPEPPKQYGDFALAQRALLLDNKCLDKHKRYWRQHLREGSLEVLNLPVDHPRQAKLAYRSDRVELCVPTDLASALSALAAECRCTLFHVLLATWALLLGRHSGAEEVVVGTPSQGRTLPGFHHFDHVCGYFVNILPLNVNISRGQSVPRLLDACRRVVIDSLSSSQVPFQYMVNELLPRLTRDPSRSTVFQTLINWLPQDGWSSGLLRWTPTLSLENVNLPSPPAATTCDVTLTACPTAAGHIEATIEFNSVLFERASIERLAKHFLVLAAAIVENREIADVWQLEMIPSMERELILTEFNNTRVDFQVRDGLLHELVWDQARRYPEIAAVEWQDSQMTYSEFESAASTTGATLRARGVTSDVVVALLFAEKSLAMATAILAVLSAGGAYLPLDPNAPVERRRLMLEDARCSHLITSDDDDDDDDDLGKLVSGIDLTVVRLGIDGRIATSSDALSSSSTPSLSRSRDLCYVIYTSGSTGRPKGVLVEHRGVVNLMHSFRPFFKASFPEAFFEDPTERLVVRYCATSNYVFDFFSLNLFNCLTILGGTSVFLSSGLSLLELEDSDNIDCIGDVASVLSLTQSLPRTVRVILTGGEKLTHRVVLNCLPRDLLNMYGPTEASIASSSNVVTDSDDANLASIGRPLANVTCYVVAPDTTELQPIGVFGELLIGGVQVARGYLNRPDLTNAKFVKNPWPETDPSGRGVVYRTGDRVRWRSNGELEFGGRIDNQVKLRGLRIELGEIEHALRAHDFVNEAVCLLRDDVGGTTTTEPQLVAYVNPAAIADVEASMLSNLRQMLPAYMVPSMIVGIEEWPRTGTSKIDRKRLPVPPPPPPPRRARGRRRPPSTPTEMRVARVVADSIGCSLDDLDAETSLFELGASSLSAVRIRFMLQKEFSGVELESTLLFDYETIRKLATVLETKSATRDDAPTNPLYDANMVDITVVETAEAHQKEQQQTVVHSALCFVCWVVAYAYVATVFVVPAWLVAWRLNQSQVESWRLAILVYAPLAWASVCVMLCLAAAATALLLAPGAVVSLESYKFVAWWTIERIDQMNRFLFLEELRRTPFLPIYYRLLGARIGVDVVLDTVNIRDPRFVSIGNGCFLGQQVIVHPRKFDAVKRRVVLQPVKLGASCRIEARAVLAAGTKLGTRTTVGALATVAAGEAIGGINEGDVGLLEPTSIWPTVCWSLFISLVALYTTIVIITASTYPAFLSLSLVLKKEGLYPPPSGRGEIDVDALHSNPEAFATFTSTYLVSPILPAMSMIFSNTDPKLQRKFFLQRYGKIARLIPLVAGVLVQHELTMLVVGVASFWIARGIRTSVTRGKQRLGLLGRSRYALPTWSDGQSGSLLENFIMFVYERLADSIYRRAVFQFGATWVLRRYYNCLGAKIGAWTHIDYLLERITNPRLLNIGKNAHLGSFCSVLPARSTTITIGDNSIVGFGAVLLGTNDGSVKIPATTIVGGNTLILGGHSELRKSSVTMNAEAIVTGAPPQEVVVTEKSAAVISRQSPASFPWDGHRSRELLDYDRSLSSYHKLLHIVAPFALLLWTRLLLGISLYVSAVTANAAFEWLVRDVQNDDEDSAREGRRFSNAKPFLVDRAFAALVFLSSFILCSACLAVINKWFWTALDAKGRTTKRWMPFGAGLWMQQFGDAGRAGFTATAFYFFSSTAAYRVFVRALGARVERGALIASPVFWDVGNATIKQNAVVEEGAMLFCHKYASDRVEVANVTIGAGALLEPGSLTTAGCELSAGSRLSSNTLGVSSSSSSSFKGHANIRPAEQHEDKQQDSYLTSSKKMHHPNGFISLNSPRQSHFRPLATTA